MQGAAAMASGVREDRVAVASTGVIGVPLDVDRVDQGHPRRPRRARRRTATRRFAEAIRPPTASPSASRSTSSCRRAPCGLSAQAKGAGMISPAFATMLCFVQTDAALAPETADLLLGVCVKRSFDRVSVDGQLSTNDTVILQASGASGVAVAPESEDELRLGEALDALLRRLALLIVRDGEGALRVGRVDGHRRPRAARSPAPPARSPTRRWSRPRCTAATRTGAGSRRPSARRCTTRRRCRSTSGSRTCRSAPAARPCRTTSAALAQAVAGPEVEYAVRLPGEGAETEVFFSDLSHEYVTINAEYTT